MKYSKNSKNYMKMDIEYLEFISMLDLDIMDPKDFKNGFKLLDNVF